MYSILGLLLLVITAIVQGGSAALLFPIRGPNTDQLPKCDDCCTAAMSTGYCPIFMEGTAYRYYSVSEYQLVKDHTILRTNFSALYNTYNVTITHFR